MIDLPRHVKVGYKRYRLRRMSEREAREDKSYGYCDNDANEIAICTDGVSRDEALNTLLHEILHACFYTGYVLPLGETPNEEHIVRRLANQLQAVFYDNPKIAALFARKI
ncbi:hypothetical protein [Enterovirga aerilata]|uniref:SprT-like domain-containing protein n=1 Tax=Enterovirga aerilata TaxID=2730920 RepID=A0A849IF65_9HYPH|nr:hypothetical protein [Enterovirga sp. DB1703]NNM74760.1 hypothetical protein [Enterovirga sp. DB1703]